MVGETVIGRADVLGTGRNVKSSRNGTSPATAPRVLSGTFTDGNISAGAACAREVEECSLIIRSNAAAGSSASGAAGASATLESCEMEAVFPELPTEAAASNETCVGDEPSFVPTASSGGTSATEPSAFRAARTDDVFGTYLWPPVPSAFLYASRKCYYWR